MRREDKDRNEGGIVIIVAVSLMAALEGGEGGKVNLWKLNLRFHFLLSEQVNKKKCVSIFSLGTFRGQKYIMNAKFFKTIPINYSQKLEKW